MTVNTDKTNYQLFTLKRKPNDINLYYKTFKLQQKDNAKYLGIHFDKKLNWKTHIEKTNAKAINCFKILKRSAGTKWVST